MDVVHPRCCGLDVHKKTVVACVLIPGPTSQPVKQVRTFETMTDQLLRLADWLAELGVTQVAMEATGVYWKPLVRHEVPRVRAEVKGLRLGPVAAGR